MTPNFKTRTMMKSGATVLVALLMGLSYPTQSYDTETVTASDLKQRAEDMKKFELFNSCLPMTLIVEKPTLDTEEFGISEEAIRNVLESRLRASRLYLTSADSQEYFDSGYTLYSHLGYAASLFAGVSVVGASFAISLSFYKPVTDLVSKVTTKATTWESGNFGLANNAGFILNNLSMMTDEFLVEYLRTNEADCHISRP